MTRGAAHALALSAACLGIAFATPRATSGQVIVGHVTDEATGNRVPGVFLTVIRPDGEPASRGDFSNGEGEFSIRLAEPGSFTVGAEMLGFQRFETGPVQVAAGQTVRLDIRLSRAPVQLDTLEARAAPLSLAEEYTMSGVRRRWAATPRAGPARVFMRPDPILQNAMVIADVQRWLPPARACMIWFVNGFRTDWAMTDMSADMFEAIEIYQRYDLVPAIFRTAETDCGVVAVWSRPPGAPGAKKLTFRRVLVFGGILGLLLLIAR